MAWQLGPARTWSTSSTFAKPSAYRSATATATRLPSSVNECHIRRQHAAEMPPSTPYVGTVARQALEGCSRGSREPFVEDDSSPACRADGRCSVRPARRGAGRLPWGQEVAEVVEARPGVEPAMHGPAQAALDAPGVRQVVPHGELQPHAEPPRRPSSSRTNQQEQRYAVPSRQKASRADADAQPSALLVPRPDQRLRCPPGVDLTITRRMWVLTPSRNTQARSPTG